MSIHWPLWSEDLRRRTSGLKSAHFIFCLSHLGLKSMWNNFYVWFEEEVKFYFSSVDIQLSTIYWKSSFSIALYYHFGHKIKCLCLCASVSEFFSLVHWSFLVPMPPVLNAVAFKLSWYLLEQVLPSCFFFF